MYKFTNNYKIIPLREETFIKYINKNYGTYNDMEIC